MSTITIVGSGFNYPLGSIADIQGQLTGTLQDGTAISVAFGHGSTASINLVPEPTTAVPLALGLA